MRFGAKSVSETDLCATVSSLSFNRPAPFAEEQGDRTSSLHSSAIAKKQIMLLPLVILQAAGALAWAPAAGGMPLARIGAARAPRSSPVVAQQKELDVEAVGKYGYPHSVSNPNLSTRYTPSTLLSALT